VSAEEKPDTAARDFELMRLVRSGDTDAFREIVQRHQHGLMNFFRKLGISNDSEDLAQETFVRLYKYRDRYEPKAKFTTFLYMMARQVRMDFLRKLKRRKALSEQLKDTAEQKDLEAAADGSARRPDVEALLSVLGDETREIIILSIYKGMKYAEISEITGVRVGTIKSRVFSAMRKMREVLKNEQ
jgi:RNA polymerase sigma-70 factor (ECF subfamily)